MPVTGNGTAVRGLGGAAGYGEIELPRGDDNALRLDLSEVFEDGLNYFGTRYGAQALYVNTNGTLSFDQPLELYPTTDNLTLGQDVIAPFWSDVDTRLDGEGAESGAIWVDIDPAGDVVTVTWADVGAYRRNAEVTNLFQVQLFDRGNGDVDIVFRYESIEWTQGTGYLDDGGRALLSSERLVTEEWVSPYGHPDALLDLPDTVGNTGARGLWLYEMRDGNVDGLSAISGLTQTGTNAPDLLTGTPQGDKLSALGGNDTLRGEDGDDHLFGGDGSDTLNGGDGDDFIFGGATSADRRDVIYGGNGDDWVDAGYGNDDVYGGFGNDNLKGDFGADNVNGQGGNDTLGGGAFSDVLHGGDGDDFLNGGFGFDRLNGGAGADQFFHAGVEGHGCDWIKDYSYAEGDTLGFGQSGATPPLFKVHLAETEGAGEAGIPEAFVVYRPTGRIVWALVDGGGEDTLTLIVSGQAYDISL